MPVDFNGISTTRGRDYDPNAIAIINESLKARNFSKEDRAAILGSIIEESGGDPFDKSISGKYQGLLQWDADRYTPQSSNKEKELNNQIQYIINTIDATNDGKSWTHGGKYSGYNTGQEAHDAFRNSNKFDDKFRALSYGFVRPSGKEASYKNRVKTASQVLSRLVVDEVLSRPDPKVEKWKPIPFTAPKPYKPKSKFNYAEGGSLTNHWDSLSQKEKAEMMRVAIQNGITTLPEIKEAYNKFAKGGPMKNWTLEDEAGYRYWRQNLPKNLRTTNDNDYDMRAAYKAGMEPRWNAEDKSYHLQSRDPESGRILKAPHHHTYLMALGEDAKLGYYPTMDSNGNTYTETWKGNIQYPREIEIPYRAYGGNLFGNGGKKNSSISPSAQRAMNYLISKGMSSTGAAAIVGTLQAESSLDPTIHAGMKGDTGEGLAQWTGSRKNNFWKVLEQIEPGAQRKYKTIDRVPFERQMDVVLAERPDVMQAINNAQNVQTATDIMLRGYENGGGTINTLASKEQMDKIYGKWNNGYDKQMSKRLGNASNLLGIAPTTYEIPQTFFDDINSQLTIPQLGVPQNEDPELRYKAPVIDETLFAKPKPLDIEVEDTDKQDRLQRINTFNTIMGLMGQQSPLAGFGSGSQDTGMMAAVNSIYSNKFDRGGILMT